MWRWWIIRAKINSWCLNFTERWAWFMNLWASMRGDLPPEHMWPVNFFSFCENLNTSLNAYKQEERLKTISLLTLYIPWLIRTEFLLTISTQYQLDNWSIILQTNITKTVWQTVRGITNEIFDQALMFGFHPMAIFWEKSNIKRIVWLTVRRIKNLIWELKG